MKTKQVTGQEALDILNNGGELYCQDYIYFKSVGSIYYKKKDGSLLMKSVLIDDEIKRLYWDVEENEPEYNLTIQQVMQKENVGKYFESDTFMPILWLTNENGMLKLIDVKDCETDLYKDIKDVLDLKYIVNSKYKEVQYKC